MRYFKIVATTVFLLALLSFNGDAQQIDAELIKAATKGDLQQVQTLLSSGASVNSVDNKGRTALMFAAEKGHTAIVKLLIENGADITATDNKGETALAKVPKNNNTVVTILVSSSKAFILPKGRTDQFRDIYLMKYPNLKELRILKKNANSNERQIYDNLSVIQDEIFSQLRSNPITIRNYDMINISGIIFRTMRPTGAEDFFFQIHQIGHLPKVFQTMVGEIYTLDDTLGSDNEELKFLKLAFIAMLEDNVLQGESGYGKGSRVAVSTALVDMKEKERNEEVLSSINRLYEKIPEKVVSKKE